MKVPGFKPSDRINGLGHWTIPDLLIEVKVPGFKPSDRINGLGHWTVPDYLPLLIAYPTLYWYYQMKAPGIVPSDRINGPAHWSIPGRSLWCIVNRYKPKVETMSPICFQYGTSLHFNWYANYITSKWSYLICCSDQLSLSKVLYIDIITPHIIIINCQIRSLVYTIICCNKMDHVVYNAIEPHDAGPLSTLCNSMAQ